MADYRNIVNIVNFLRGYENDGTDLVESIRQNVYLLNKYELKSTFLIQYDVFNSEEMMSLIKNAGPLFELGCWLEIVEPLVVDAGLRWRGREPWDFHANVAFLMGYTISERKRIIDTYMARFKREFGTYPKAAGAWMIDSVSLEYLYEKYGIRAACICKEQYGTDGYNLWGGYYNHAYYPSKYNMICPAQTRENQIDLPVFRMLGTDPVHQYDSGLISADGKINPAKKQDVITIEPVYPQYGGNPQWVDWFLEQNTKGNQLCYSYVQIGQENSFDWRRSGDGLKYQYPKVKQLAQEGKIEVEYLSESGKWFKENFTLSPVCAQPFCVDWSTEDAKSFWYYSRFYRLNLYLKDGKIKIRDFHKYDEKYKERYYDGVEDKIYSTYDNLPIVDGYRFSREDFCAGGYFYDENGEEQVILGAEYSQCDKSVQKITARTASGELKFTASENKLEIKSDFGELKIKMSGTLQNVGYDLISEKEIVLTHNGYNYSLPLSKGKYDICDGELTAFSIGGEVTFDFFE